MAAENEDEKLEPLSWIAVKLLGVRGLLLSGVPAEFPGVVGEALLFGRSELSGVGGTSPLFGGSELSGVRGASPLLGGLVELSCTGEKAEAELSGSWGRELAEVTAEELSAVRGKRLSTLEAESSGVGTGATWTVAAVGEG